MHALIGRGLSTQAGQSRDHLLHEVATVIITVGSAGPRVPPYTVVGWPYSQVLGFPLE